MSERMHRGELPRSVQRPALPFLKKSVPIRNDLECGGKKKCFSFGGKLNGGEFFNCQPDVIWSWGVGWHVPGSEAPMGSSRR